MTAPHDPPADDSPEVPAAAASDDPAEDLKAKYRDALAHKHASSGAKKSGHDDQGATSHGPEQAHTQRMFRRKAGG